MDDGKDGADLIEVCSLDEIPEFESEAAEAAWWSKHEISTELWRRYGRRVGDSLVLELPVQRTAKSHAARDS